MEFFQEALNNVKNYLQFISITDMADVLIVAFLIYQLLSLIYKTNAAQVLKGIALLLALLGLSYLFGLNVLSFILANAMQAGLIALLIMFQPELRKVLETVGASRFPSLFEKFSGDSSNSGMPGVIAQTVSACNTLSQQKIGVLIVFERKVFLNDAIASGTIIDAEVTSMLLKNIFFPKAALHDGAAIIRDGRIISAGCMLPLTGNINLSRDLGMRHRAGVGVSEASDAVAVIVSEETGSVSVAAGGLLKRHLNTETLSAILKNELIASADTAQSNGVLTRTLRYLFRRGGRDEKND